MRSRLTGNTKNDGAAAAEYTRQVLRNRQREKGATSALLWLQRHGYTDPDQFLPFLT